MIGSMKYDKPQPISHSIAVSQIAHPSALWNSGTPKTLYTRYQCTRPCTPAAPIGTPTCSLISTATRKQPIHGLGGWSPRRASASNRLLSSWVLKEATCKYAASYRPPSHSAGGWMPSSLSECSVLDSSCARHGRQAFQSYILQAT